MNNKQWKNVSVSSVNDSEKHNCIYTEFSFCEGSINDSNIPIASLCNDFRINKSTSFPPATRCCISEH